ncbi:MAG: arsenic resistance protein [Pseudomonadota bacterium]
MLNRSLLERLTSATSTSIVLISAIVIGALLGHLQPATGEWLSDRLDYTLLTLVSLLFFGVRFDALLRLAKSARFLAIAVAANFVAIPLIGFGIATLFLSDYPLFFVGLVIYFLSPCTDWFLSFTRLSNGDVAIGTALIPINMTLQLLLYPFYLEWFTQNAVQAEMMAISSILLQWFLLPFLLALAVHQLLRKFMQPTDFEAVLNVADRATLWVTALLILQLFAGNISVMLTHSSLLGWLLLAVFCFFVVVYLLGEGISRAFKLPYRERALLSMTMASRNAPLMLAVSMVVLPDQPLIYAALVIGMLIEIPHLAALSHVLLRSQRAQNGVIPEPTGGREPL